MTHPRVFLPGQYFLYDQTSWAFLCYLGLRVPQKVYISEVVSINQRNFPVFEVPEAAARGLRLGQRPYVEGPYGGLEFSTFTQWSKFFVLVAEDLGLGRQLFLLQEIIQQEPNFPVKIFLIWIIRHQRHVRSLLDFYSWSMTRKNGNIESKVRNRKYLKLFIKIYGTSVHVETKPGNNNIYIDTNPRRYQHDCVPFIKDGVDWNGRGLSEVDFGSTSLSGRT
ncbi:hypothetical protein TWF481_006241 [Arthrobotrys musiformis]|uniref:Uncharacterized protein n=1 Tax=Arthrobotrys musiformis TaxID=47236 RepID=A0AAV9WI45_9PEZI